MQSTYPLYKFDIKLPGHLDKIMESVVVKFSPVFDDNIEGLTEFNNMQLMRNVLKGDVKLAAVMPLEYISEIDALVTEYVPHQRLSEKILQKCVYSLSVNMLDDLNLQVVNSGKWLSAFHNATTGSHCTLGETEYLKRILLLVEYLRKIGILKDAVCKVANFLTDYKSELESLVLPMSRVHGDFGPQNIGVGENEKIYVFDLQRQHNEAIYHDIAYFITTLETLNPYPKHKCFNRSQAISLSAGFMRGYKEFSVYANEWDDLTYHLYYMGNLLQRSQKQCLNQKLEKKYGIASRAKKLFIQNTFNSKIKRELMTIEALIR